MATVSNFVYRIIHTTQGVVILHLVQIESITTSSSTLFQLPSLSIRKYYGNTTHPLNKHYEDTRQNSAKRRSTNEMKENQQNQIGQEIKYQLVGWILFIICAIFFIASSLKNHDTLTFLGSVVFLIACIVFLIPLARSINKMNNDKK